MLWFSMLFGFNANALTIESHCQRIAIKAERTEMSLIHPDQCVINQIYKKTNATFVTTAAQPNKYIFLKRQIDDAFFCKMPFDYLGFFDAEKNSEKKTWNSKDAFTSLVRMTNDGGVIRRNAEESKVKKVNFCSAFPAFEKVRNVPLGVMSELLVNMKNGGYLMVSSKFSSLYFFGLDLKQVEFVFNLPGDMEVIDAIVRKNGELIILSTNRDESLCINRWDLITGTMIKTRCGLKNYNQQLLIDREKMTRAYIKNNVLYFEEFDQVLDSKILPVMKGIGEFNLSSAFAYED